LIYDKEKNSRAKLFLIAGISFNLILLGYYKYANFFVNNTNILLSTHLFLKTVILPLGISFFTFTQIAFLVDTYKKKSKEYGFVNYCLFVSYFPHLLAGPIIHHAQIMPQFSNQLNARINYRNIYHGLILFIIGLSKKVILADTFAFLANNGYAHVTNLNFSEAWITSLAYTFQIYFDFSGYTDMARGASKLFNIELPINFNSPYQSLNIQEFWRCWHITLSNFLKDYIYIPLGGNKVSEIKIYRNLILTFLLGGFWHGAGWNFIVWGLLHGTALSFYRAIKPYTKQMPDIISWLVTFNFVNITWIFFRSNTLPEGITFLQKMFDFSHISPVGINIIGLFSLALLAGTCLPNSNKIMKYELINKIIFIAPISILMVLSIIVMEISNSHEFIYFQF
jgi:D-alanyl-lipoteichoic acid acyltransferase DltB (MBOAT superfamily)